MTEQTDLTPSRNNSFSLKDCALVTLATGKKASQLDEFRNRLAEVDLGSIYHHFWGTLLQARFEEREYNNDFASWVRHEIHDPVLAEQLSVMDPLMFDSLEALRTAIVDLIDERLDEAKQIAFSFPSKPFVFECSQIVVFDTGRQIERPEELQQIIGELATGSIFYHFIDARRRTPDHRDDFSDWLEGFRDTHIDLQNSLAEIDPYFGSLAELRESLASLFNRYFRGTDG